MKLTDRLYRAREWRMTFPGCAMVCHPWQTRPHMHVPAALRERVIKGVHYGL